jgi:hypothetical protein
MHDGAVKRVELHLAGENRISLDLQLRCYSQTNGSITKRTNSKSIDTCL